MYQIPIYNGIIKLEEDFKMDGNKLDLTQETGDSAVIQMLMRDIQRNETKIKELEEKLTEADKYILGQLNDYDYNVRERFDSTKVSTETSINNVSNNLKTVVTGMAVSAVLTTIAIAALCFVCWSNNKTFQEHAVAINNNSYSIESIIESFRE